MAVSRAGDRARLFNLGSSPTDPGARLATGDYLQARPALPSGAGPGAGPAEEASLSAPAPIAPAEYRLDLGIDFAGLAWTGVVAFDLPAGVRACVLDAEGLAIEDVTAGGRAIPFAHDATAHRLAIGPLEAPGAAVAVRFSGRVNRHALSGLYRSRHGNGYVLTAQCEPTGASTIFPCVDRPDRKARVRLSVRTAPGLEVVANAPVEARSETDGLVRWTFAPTPPMATYLFYVAVGRFDRLDGQARRATIRVLTAPGRGAAGRFALGLAGRVLDAFDDYYGIPYPLPKLDLLAIEEHAFGAMENWGAISFQANRLLVDPSSSSFAARDVFETTAHEIAHQWFGNLVTMAWWTDIWLNESFAALMETKITERLEPALDARADFFLRTAGMAAAIDGDSFRSTHPVRAPVRSPDEIGQIFDEISYGKGSSVLAMLEAYLGEETFRRGVADYLARFRHGNAETDDLWRSLERASPEPVATIAGPWIDRPGLPVVSATIGPRGLELRQRRFTYLGLAEEAPWPIPMVIDVDGQRQRLRFDTAQRTVPVDPGATVHLNPGAVGFYRTLYDPTLAARLLAALPGRPAPDRWIVLEDLAAFLAAGAVDWATYARFVRTLGPTHDRLVVETVSRALVGFALAFPRSAPVLATVREFFGPQTDRLGATRRADEPASDGILREHVAFGRVRLDLDYARRLGSGFADWERVDPDLRLATAVGLARTGGADGFAALRAALERTTVDAEGWRLARALGWGADPDRLRETLDFAVGGGVNRSFLMGLLIQAASNPEAREMMWPWFTERLEAIVGAFHGSGSLPVVFEHAVPALAAGRAEEVRAFFARRPVPEGSRGVAKALERIEIHERLARSLAAAPAGPDRPAA